MTRKISEKTRDSLLKMNSDERRDERCTIMKRLTAECKKLTSTQDKEIDAISAKIKSLEELRTRAQKDRKGIIKKHKMVGVMDRINYTSGCATDEQHPELLEFDAESNNQRREILLM